MDLKMHRATVEFETFFAAPANATPAEIKHLGAKFLHEEMQSSGIQSSDVNIITPTSALGLNADWELDCCIWNEAGKNITLEQGFALNGVDYKKEVQEAFTSHINRIQNTGVSTVQEAG